MFHALRPLATSAMWQAPRFWSGYLLLVVNEYLTRASGYNVHEVIIAVNRCDVLQNSR